MRKAPQKNPSSSQNFSLFNHQKTSFLNKIAISLLAQENFSKLTSWLIFSIEYLQLVSQLILMASNSYTGSENSRFFEVITYAAKLINPSHLLEYYSHESLTTTILYIILISTVVKYVFLASIITEIVLNKKPSNLASKACQWILKVQGRASYFFLSSFWVNSLIGVNLNNFSLFGLGKISSNIFCTVLIVIEGIFSVLTTMNYCCLFPTICALSAKDNYLEFLTLFQKMFVQFFQIVLFQETQISALKWIFASINLSFSFLKILHYFRTLPIYNMKFLIHHWIVLMIVFALDASFFLQLAVIAFGYHASNLALLIIMWVANAILLSKAMNNSLKKKIFELLASTQHQTSAKLIMHKIQMIQQVRTDTVFPCEFNTRYEFSYLLNEAVNAHVEQIFSAKPQQDKKFNIQNQTSFRDVFTDYLDLLLNKFPKNHLMKLYVAHMYSQTLKKYGKSLRLIAELQNTNNSKVALNASLLAQKLQDLIKTEGSSKSDHNGINLSTFVKGQFYNAQLKENIIQQMKQQVQLCKEISQDRPNLSNIQDCAFLVRKYKQNTAHNISQIQRKMPEYDTEPFLLYAYYQLVANFCPDKHQEYLKIYKHRQLKHMKYLQAAQLAEENLYQKDNVFLVLSGQKEEAGKIVSCSKSTEAILGGDQKFFIGTKASSLFLPQTKFFDDLLLSQTLEAGNNQGLLSDSLRRGFLLHKDGHMIEVDYYVNIYPYLTHGLYLGMIIRKVPNTKDSILIHRNGEIEGVTQNAGKKIKFIGSEQSRSTRGVNIETISPELARVNAAFNRVTASERDSPSPKKLNLEEFVRLSMKEENSEDIETLNKDTPGRLSGGVYSFNEKKIAKFKSRVSAEEARNLHNLYATEGAIVHLFPMKKKTDGSSFSSLPYHCKVAELTFGSINMKLISLTELDPNFGSSNQNLKLSPPNKNLNTHDEADEDTQCEELPIRQQDNFFLPDEKENGWINFDAMQACLTPKLSLSTERHNLITGLHHTENAQIILKDDEDTPNTAPENRKNILLSRFRLPTAQKESTFESPYLSPSPGLLEIDELELHQVSPKAGPGPKSVAAESQLSLTASRTKTSRIFQNALNVKYYDNPFKIFCALFCLLLISLFVCEILLKDNLDQTMENIQDNKTILVNAQLRTSYLVFLQATFRIVQMTLSGYLSQTDLGPFYKTGSGYSSNLKNSTLVLSGINSVLLAQADSLGENARKSLFATDVRMFDINSSTPAHPYMNVTSFQATDQIVSYSMIAIRNLILLPSSISLYLDFIHRNSLNDLYLKNQQIADYFSSLIQDQIKQDQIAKIAYLGIVMFFVVLTTIVINVIIIKNYKREVHHMDAFTRFNAQIIRNIEENLKHFLKTLHEGTSFLENQDLDSVKANQAFFIKKENINKLNSKTTISSGIMRKYTIYSARYLAAMLVITALILWSVLSAIRGLEFLSDKINHLNFVYRLNTRVNMEATIAVELFVAPAGTLIENELLPVVMTNTVEDIKLLRTQISTDIFDQDLLQNPKIQEILEKEGCNLIDSIYVNFCKTLKSNGISTNFVQLLSSFEGLLVARYQAYQQSDKSTTSLQKIEATNFAVFVSMKRVLTGINFLLADTIDKEIRDYITKEKTSRSEIFTSFCCLLVGLIVLVWIFIFSKVREIDNRLKKVLQTLPPELVLSSFILKSFLMNTSSGTIEAIKDKI